MLLHSFVHAGSDIYYFRKDFKIFVSFVLLPFFVPDHLQKR